MRPEVPAELLEFESAWLTVPDHTLPEWVTETLFNPASELYNEDHRHLADAKIGFLWTAVSAASKGLAIIGQAEMPMFRCGKWQRARQEQQIIEWFGEIPDFLITLDANYCNEACDDEFMALIEHELYHCAQAIDKFGMPRFNKDTGEPVFAMRGHDVEEFIGVVARYGMVSDSVRQLVDAAGAKPAITNLMLSHVCGTCTSKG